VFLWIRKTRAAGFNYKSESINRLDTRNLNQYSIIKLPYNVFSVIFSFIHMLGEKEKDLLVFRFSHN